MSEKIRILFLSANPSTTSLIRVEEEAFEISGMLEKGSAQDDFELITHRALKAGDLPYLLMNHRPHIVHFSGHGSLAREIIVEGAGGRGERITTEALVEVFKVHGGDVRVVVLNACLTRPAAQALSGVIDYTIGIRSVIDDRHAL